MGDSPVGIQAANVKGEDLLNRGGANLACPVLQVLLLRLPFLNHCLDHFLISLQGEEPSHHLSWPPLPEAVPRTWECWPCPLEPLHTVFHPHLEQIHQL